MAASTTALASVGCVKSTPAALSSVSAFRTSSVQLVRVCSAASGAQRLVSTTASLSEGQSVTRRDVLTNLLGAGAGLCFDGQALAANPGSLARQRKVKKREFKPKEKPEEVKAVASETATPTPEAPAEVSSAPVELKIPEVSSLPEPLSSPDVPSIPEVVSTPQAPSVPEVPDPPEAPSAKVEAANYEDCNLGDYFKDLF